MRPVVYSNLMSGFWVASCGYVNYEQGWVGRVPLDFARVPRLVSAVEPPLGSARGPFRELRITKYKVRGGVGFC